MKKYLFLSLACLLISSSAFSQLRFGVKGGVNLSGVSFNEGNFADKNVTGFTIGPSLEWLIGGNFGLEGGLMYSQRGIKFKDGDLQNDEKIGYIDIPVNLKYRLNLTESIKPFLTAGPYMNFKVSGEDTFGDTGTSISNQWKAKSFGIGLNFGAGVELLKFLQIGIGYGFSVTDNYKASDGSYKAKNNTWSATAAIYF